MTKEATETAITEFLPDGDNANRGTPRGRKTVRRSLKKLGAGRSILVDRNNVTVAGNKTLEEAKRLRMPARVIETDGTELIVVRRTDLDLKTDKKAKELAITDNRSSELGLAWDPEVLESTEADLSDLFEPVELDEITNGGKGRKHTEKIDLQPPPKMIWILLGVPFNRFDSIQEPLAAIEKESEISVQQARNE